MIVATREFIYGIDVYSFNSSKRVPYQLSFDSTVDPNQTVVSLVNLLGLSDCLYCKYLRGAVCQYVFEHMMEKRCEIYFSVEILPNKEFTLFKKFIRWMQIENRILTDITITPIDDIQFIEFKLSVNPDYSRQLKVAKA